MKLIQNLLINQLKFSEIPDIWHSLSSGLFAKLINIKHYVPQLKNKKIKK